MKTLTKLVMTTLAVGTSYIIIKTYGACKYLEGVCDTTISFKAKETK